MNLLRALRFDHPNAAKSVISLVGAGGKTTALFRLAREFLELNPGPRSVLVTATTHLGVWQIPLADHHIVMKEAEIPNKLPGEGVILVTGETREDRTTPISETTLNWLREVQREQNIPLLIEADGSRQKPLKAPAEHEPPVPPFSEVVIYLAGLSALGKPLHEEHVHRPEIFTQISGLTPHHPITPQAILNALTHPQGGLKHIPPNARRVVLLNQADTPELQSIGGRMARDVLNAWDAVLVGSLEQHHIITLEPTAGIILAAGKSTRFGEPKQLLDWKGRPFVRHVAEIALHAGLDPVVVVTGFHHADIEAALKDLPVTLVHNLHYGQGQSTSIKAGIQALPQKTGSAIFLLADQPQIPGEVIRALTEAHARNLPPILAPLVLEERRANPVLFDKVAFPDLMTLTGDTGGRAIFDKHRVEYLPWHDDILLFDVDKPEDYARLKGLES